METMYDVIIVGSGPAGLAAAIYAARAKLKMLVLEKAPMSGGQIINTYEVDNYPGIPQINGFDLAVKFREHCEKLGAEFLEGEAVSFELEGEIKKVILDDNRQFQTKTIILAMGTIWRKLGVPGEDTFSGKGISYCATCDGAFFKNKTVAVVGGGDVAAEDAIFLARLCKKVYLIHRRGELRAAKVLVEALKTFQNVELLFHKTVEEIIGEEVVKKVRLKNLLEDKTEELAVDGIFIAVGSLPDTKVFQGVLSMDDNGYLEAGEDCRTSVAGVFAAGDVRTKILRQVVTAAADGATAITGVEHYLNGR